MPIFEYQATDAAGALQRGTQVGASMDAAAKELAGRGLQVTSLSLTGQDLDLTPRPPQPEASSHVMDEYVTHENTPRAETERLMERRSYWATDVVGTTVGKVALPAIAFFFRQFAVMINAGVSPTQALNTLAGQTQSPKLGRILRELSQHALEGRPMSFGMQRYPEVFSPLVLSLVRVGERSGTMVEACNLVATYTEREIAIRNLVRRVTIYPKIVIALSIVILSAASAIISSLGKKSQLSAPLMTMSTWIWLGPLLIGLFLFYRVGLANARIRYNYEGFLLAIPYIGGTVKQFAMAKFGRALGTLYAAGVPIHEAFRLSADACGNEYLRSRMMPAIRGIEGGATLHSTMLATNAFNPIVLDMVATGEQTGSLNQMLEKVAEYYEGESETRSVKMGYILGAVALLGVGVYIGYIYIQNMMSIVGGGLQSALKETGN
ncbi:MAG: type II secretion system F family protein [Chthonomonas sp.]|nr:type II secretion system F family protein [Chthonomonas sp.]